MSETLEKLTWETATVGRRAQKIAGSSHSRKVGTIVAIEVSITQNKKFVWIKFDGCAEDCAATKQSAKLNACNGFELSQLRILPIEQCICDFNSVLMVFGCQCGGK